MTKDVVKAAATWQTPRGESKKVASILKPPRSPSKKAGDSKTAAKHLVWLCKQLKGHEEEFNVACKALAYAFTSKNVFAVAPRR